jgi:predicted deacylase
LYAVVVGLPAETEEQALRRLLACEAITAELVLDLHCDDVALPYLYTSPQSWPGLSDLAARLGARAVLVAEDSGGGSFDEAFSLPWLHLARAFPDRPMPQGTDAVTVELRGVQDVSSALAGADARAIFDVLVGRGLIVGAVSAAPALRCEAQPTAGCQQLRASVTGIVVYVVGLGDWVRRGDLIAEVLDPMAEAPGGGRVAHRAGTDGLVLALRGHRAVVPGQIIARIAGKTILQEKSLLAD